MMKERKYSARSAIYTLPETYAKSRAGSIDATITLVDTMALINKLDKRGREIILRKYFYGYTTAEIAAWLGVTHKTAEGAITRALNFIDSIYAWQMRHDEQRNI